jgi:hypothetical protein
VIWDAIKLKIMQNNSYIISRFFYTILIISVILYCIPGKYKIAIYGLNILGWFTVVFIILSFVYFTIITFFFLKKRDYKSLRSVVIVFLFTIIICRIVEYYDSIRNDSIRLENSKEIIDD